MPDELTRGSTRKTRRHRPAFHDGWVLGTLWAAEGSLVRLLGSATRRRPEGDEVAAAYRHLRSAIDIVNRRVDRRTDG
jgi:hypothetical protein